MSAEFIWKLWNQQYGLPQENFYSDLLHTSRNLLDFKVPQGLQMNFTACPSSTFANSHRLTIFPNIGGSLSFLHSSRPFAGYRGTKSVSLNDVIDGYRTVNEVQSPLDPHLQEIWHRGRRVDFRDTLLYGRLHLPRSKLEAIFARRLSPTRQLILTALSSATLPNGGTIFAQLQQDYGTHTNEWIYNTDDALIGFRHMRQLGADPRDRILRALAETEANIAETGEAIDLLTELPFPQVPADLPLSAYGRFSAGMEIYYGALHKSGGISLGMRFATLPFYHGHPRTMTLTVNPLVGHLSSTYTMKIAGLATLCSRLDFNIFSYESDLTLGGEVWHYPATRHKKTQVGIRLGDEPEDRLGFERADIVTLDSAKDKELVPSGVVKAYVHSATLMGGLLWEGRVKDFLVSIGGRFDLSKRAFGAFGVEMQYGA
ncbi:Mitochondrial distribution and morphology protein 10 [Taphrina deformans PYCC 5710]|uniref:Mitochondrial distribution and morphology protein 10 n=1 Tax=Taphrina deformans (strain PYCC 5710 / ATCC 11124 / CBS 356.35 / IMI 108563 / JCM 9778 / NBRC 8474) TaxID=1097556 RepID=R4X9B3_TAPDE|nr:Mitochondrial distribution and morphology protein 10 [Taphrina deformans PYCC 5710]|eukprot:CCG80777.1 Mitochondrial distribution and morphology protein 10 [Taphrina deformans PYCC 5710]